MAKSNNHDRIIFNGHDLSSIVMCRVERPIMPPAEISRESIGGRHGELFRRSRMEGYTVPVTVYLRTTDRREVAEARHRLAAMLWTESPAPLYLPDDPTRYHLAIVSGSTDLGEITDELPSTTINFYVCDPIAYGNKRTARLADGAARAIDAGGTWEALPVVRSKATGGAWRVTNVDTGDFVEINAETVGGEVAVGGSIVCDMATERVTVDGVDVGVTVTSDFFGIRGRQTLSVSGGTGTRLEWEERWL